MIEMSWHGNNVRNKDNPQPNSSNGMQFND